MFASSELHGSHHPGGIPARFLAEQPAMVAAQ
jgi:hypothetical protein